MIIFSNNKNEFYAMDLESGNIKWKQKINSSVQPSIINNLIFTITNEGFLVILDSKKKKGILLEPLTWCKVTFKTKNAVMMVFCDREYEFNDYIEVYSEFKKIIRKK